MVLEYDAGGGSGMREVVPVLGKSIGLRGSDRGGW